MGGGGEGGGGGGGFNPVHLVQQAVSNPGEALLNSNPLTNPIINPLGHMIGQKVTGALGLNGKPKGTGPGSVIQYKNQPGGPMNDLTQEQMRQQRLTSSSAQALVTGERGDTSKPFVTIRKALGQ